jgi:hypothetical protein
MWWLSTPASRTPCLCRYDSVTGWCLCVSLCNTPCAHRYATGLMDGTIKLWTPFRTTSTTNSSNSSSSSSSRQASGLGRRKVPDATPIRPSRTLTGHTDQITCLTCLTPTQQQQQQQQHSILVSGSADKAIKLWSLACVQQPSSSGSSSSGGSGGSSVRHSSRKHKQQASSLLLGTLRGHSSAVSSVLPWPAVPAGSSPADAPGGSSSSSSSSGCSGVLSGGQDGRVKLWVVDEGRRACAATWRLPDSCQQLLAGLDMPGCAVARLDRCLLVSDFFFWVGGLTTALAMSVC